MVELANTFPPVGVSYQSTVSFEPTLTEIEGIAEPAQKALSPAELGAFTVGQAQFGAVTDKKV